MLRKSLMFVAILSLLVFGAVVTGAADQVEITFWHAMSSGHQSTLQALADEFMQAHPDIKVTLVYQGHYGDLSQKLLSAVAAGTPPVMAQMYEDWTMKFIEADALVPLGPSVPQDVIDDIPQSFIDSNTYVVNGEKVLMTLPFNKSAMVLFYNTDLVKNPPKTWDELLQTAKDLTVDSDGDGTPDQYGFGIRPYTEFFINFFHQAGGKILNDDMTKCLINSPEGIQAMEYLLNLKQYSLYQTSYLSGPFGNGKVAMYIGSSAGTPYVAKASEGKHGWMTAVLPVGPKNGDGIIQGTNIGVFQLGTTQAQRDAAIEFAKFLISKEATLQWAEETGYLPIRKSAVASDEWKEFITQHPEAEASGQMALAGFVYPHHPNMYNIRQSIATAFEQVMLGKATPKEALDAAAQEIDTEYLGD